MVQERSSEGTEMVMNGTDNTRDFDQFVKGMVHAFNEILEMKPEIEMEIPEENGTT